MNARQVRKALQLACPYAVCAQRSKIGATDVSKAIALLDRGGRTRIGFMP